MPIETFKVTVRNAPMGIQCNILLISAKKSVHSPFQKMNWYNLVELTTIDELFCLKELLQK